LHGNVRYNNYSPPKHLLDIYLPANANGKLPLVILIHGEKDELVSPNQSRLLSSWLSVAGVQNELFIVKDAPHFGVMFDSEEVRNKVIIFLRKQLN
jgi:acetyl esterase/lipase